MGFCLNKNLIIFLEFFVLLAWRLLAKMAVFLIDPYFVGDYCFDSLITKSNFANNYAFFKTLQCYRSFDNFYNDVLIFPQKNLKNGEPVSLDPILWTVILNPPFSHVQAIQLREMLALLLDSAETLDKKQILDEEIRLILQKTHKMVVLYRFILKKWDAKILAFLNEHYPELTTTFSGLIPLKDKLIGVFRVYQWFLRTLRDVLLKRLLLGVAEIV